MKKITIFTVLLLALLSVAVSVAGADSPQRETTQRTISPMMTEMKAANAAAKIEVARLGEQIKSAVGNEQIMTLQKEVSRVKSAARLETFRIQLRYAVADDRQEDIQKLEEIINHMTTPRATQIPTRPAPTRTGKP